MAIVAVLQCGFMERSMSGVRGRRSIKVEVEIHLHRVPYTQNSPLDAKICPDNPLLPSRDLSPFVLPHGKENVPVSKGS
jgi:hypothetical protein